MHRRDKILHDNARGRLKSHVCTIRCPREGFKSPPPSLDNQNRHIYICLLLLLIRRGLVLIVIVTTGRGVGGIRRERGHAIGSLLLILIGLAFEIINLLL